MSPIELASVLEEMTVNEVIAQYPPTVAVFSEFGIDACCGGALRVREAASRHGIGSEALLWALLCASRTAELVSREG